VTGEPAPELELAVDTEGLAAEAELKPYTLLAHPHRALEAAADQDFGQVGIAAILGQPAHIVEIFFLGIRPEIDIPELGLVHVGDQAREVSRAVIERARQMPGREKEVWDFYRSNANALAQLRAPIYEDKVVDFILELANVTEKKVTREDLFKEDETEKSVA